MKSANRISGIDIIGDIPWGTHLCQFYQTKEDLMDILVPYFKAGLENNEFCLWVVSDQLDEGQAKEALKVAIPDIDAYIENGQIEIIPYTYWYIKEGIIDSHVLLNQLIEKANHVLASGYDGLRFSGDHFSVETHWQNLISYDKILDSATGNYQVIVLCTYFYNNCDAVQIAEVISNHQYSLIKKDERWNKIENSGRKRAEEAETKLEHLVKERTSELEKAYNSLKESEKGLAEAQKMAHIGNWEWDIATDKAYWSNELYRIFGRDPQKLAPTINEFYNYIHPDDRHDIVNLDNKALNEKSSLCKELKILSDDGEERRVHMQSEIIFDEKNVPIRIKGVVQDITERKRTEERVQSLANVVESSQDAIVTVSLDGIVSSWNKGAEQVYGYSAEEILRKDVSILAPDNLKDEPKKLIDRIKHGINIKNYETSRLKKDGTLITVSITVSPVFDIHGKLTYISAIYRDITKRKRVEEKLRESEEKYRNIVETANELIFTTDNENVITYVNKKIEDMLGYTPEEIIGRPIWDSISEECRPIVKKNLENRKQGVSGSYELKLIRKDGSSLWTFLNAKPLFDKKGKYVGAISMLTDITEHKKAEETLNNIEIARKKEIHHRIKNNLQVISSLLDLQAEKFDNPKVIEAFRESQDRVISMALIHEELYKGEGTDILDFSTYIRELAENLFRTYRYSAKNIHLTMDLEENAFFDMDTAVPLGIIINELVSNSLKHAFQGKDEGEIRIKLSREECEGSKSDSFVLLVSDNGVGILENLDIEDLDSLGIQLINTLVEQLNGELELKRKNGTEFAIRFTVRGE